MMESPLIEPIPIERLDAKPKGRGGARVGAGRPRKMNDDKTAYVHPVGGRTRAPRKRTATPRPSSRSLIPELVGFLTMVNMGVAFTPFGTRHEATGEFTQIELAPGVTLPMPVTRITKLGDELDDIEIQVLAQSINAQCERNPTVKKYVSGFLGLSAGAGLAGVVGMIVARRLSRHGIIDPSLDAKFGAAMAGDLTALAAFQTPQDEPSADPEAEPSPNRDAPLPTGSVDFASL